MSRLSRISSATAKRLAREDGTLVAVDATRIDQWLWAIRVCRTRSQATATCRGGHVRVNGRPAKAATPVAVGDRVRVHINGAERDLEVVRLIEKRVGAPVAAGCYIDHTAPAAEPERQGAFAVRDRGSGRPSKRERRQLDRLRGRRN